MVISKITLDPKVQLYLNHVLWLWKADDDLQLRYAGVNLPVGCGEPCGDLHSANLARDIPVLDSLVNVYSCGSC